eukprot:365593-Chlamydomonas_euryale.AAC.9
MWGTMIKFQGHKHVRILMMQQSRMALRLCTARNGEQWANSAQCKKQGSRKAVHSGQTVHSGRSVHCGKNCSLEKGPRKGERCDWPKLGLQRASELGSLGEVSQTLHGVTAPHCVTRMLQAERS